MIEKRRISGNIGGDYDIHLASEDGRKSLVAYLAIDAQNRWGLTFVVTDRSKAEVSQFQCGSLNSAIRAYDSI